MRFRPEGAQQPSPGQRSGSTGLSFPGQRSHPVGGRAAAPAPAAAEPGAPRPAAAAVAPGAVALEAKGYLIPAHQLQVSPIEVSGRILKLNFEEGKHVQQDEILAELDKTSYQADLAEAV